ncbi:MAG: FG-GAP repeat domain-containing protein [Akkermansiaceae bacterium]
MSETKKTVALQKPKMKLRGSVRLVIALCAVVAVIYSLIHFLNTRDVYSSDIEPHVTASDKKALVPIHRGESWEEMDDPSKDGWDTEVLASKATKQLKEIGKLLNDFDTVNTESLAKLVDDDFACELLRPAEMTTVIEDEFLTIERLKAVPPLPSLENSTVMDDHIGTLKHRGADGLAESIRIAFSPFSKIKNIQFKAKIFKVLKKPNTVLTRQYLSISGTKPDGSESPGKIELHTTWDMSWKLGSDGAKPKIRWIRVVEFEQTESRQPGGAMFVDCTESVLGSNPAYAEQFLFGLNHWFERIQDKGSDVLRGNPGLAVGDVNGDGLDDLYVCQERGLPNRIFIQNADGTAREESAQRGVDWLQSSRSALFVDLDNDSDQDLVVAILGGLVLAENNGEGNFTLRNVLKTGDDVMSLSAADYDMDGRLDLYACLYYREKKLGSGAQQAVASAEAGFTLHDANNGARNVFFKNEINVTGEWNFVDVTERVGLDVNNHRYSLAASWDDFDNDGDLDLYVANDYGRDHLYRNDSSLDADAEQGRKFVDISNTANVEDSATGMSTSWADYDRDGWMDIFVANMWSSAGNRITFQDRFKSNASPEAKRRFQRVARGNTLLHNQGDGTFADHSAQAGIEMGRWAWGTNFIDLNNDGWEDVVVANGYITTEDTGDL